MTLSELKRENPTWFGKGNANFFGDVAYKVLKGRSNVFYLVRKSSAFSDMFENKKSYRWYINPINTLNWEIKPMLSENFRELEDVKEFLKTV